MPTGEQLIQDLLHPHIAARESLGLTPLYWARQLKAESKAKVSKTLKVKGAISNSALPRGVKVMAVTGVIVSMADGARDYSDGESVVTWDEVDWGTRQRARMDAQKLDNAYPTEKLELSGNLNLYDKLKEARERASRERTKD